MKKNVGKWVKVDQFYEKKAGNLQKLSKHLTKIGKKMKKIDCKSRKNVENLLKIGLNYEKIKLNIIENWVKI